MAVWSGGTRGEPPGPRSCSSKGKSLGGSVTRIVGHLSCQMQLDFLRSPWHLALAIVRPLRNLLLRNLGV